MIQELTRAWHEYHDLMPDYYLTEAQMKQVITREGIAKIVTIPDHFDGACCHETHYRYEKDATGRVRLVDRPDAVVCARERAWRRYCSIRDREVS